MSSNIDKKEFDKLLHSLALKYNMSDEDYAKIVHSPFEFAKHRIRELDFTKIETEEDLDNLNTNFIFTSFFSLVVDYDCIKARNNRRDSINKHINFKNKKDK